MCRRMTEAEERALTRRRGELEQQWKIGSITRPKYHPALRGKIGPKVVTVKPEYFYFDRRSGQLTAEFLPTGSRKEWVMRWLVCSYRHAVMREIHV